MRPSRTSHSKLRRRPALFALAASAFCAMGPNGCSPTTEPASVRVDHVNLTPPAVTLAVGAEQQIIATCVDASNAPMIGMAVSWASQSPSVASVNVSGLVRAVARGNTQVTATCDLQGSPKQASVSVTVTLIPAASVIVEPATFLLAPGQTQQLTATPKDAAGNPLSDRTVAWRSSNTAVATVSTAGLVSAVGGGTATISATTENTTGFSSATVPLPVASVTMSPSNVTIFVGSTVQLTATPRDSTGAPLIGRVIVWSSSSLAVAGVSASGFLTAFNGGAATITATSEGRIASASVVVPTPVASVMLAPALASMVELRTLVPLVTLRDAANNILQGRSVTWTSNDTSVAQVSSSGTITARRQGTAVITAASEGRSGTLSVTVTLAPVGSVVVSPVNATLSVNQTQQHAAAVKDSLGNTLVGRTVTWTSSAPGVATVSPAGLVTTVAPGSATITASSGGSSGTTFITVAAPVASVVVAPAAATLTAGQTQQLTATPRDAAGTVLTGRNVVWTSSTPAVATVSANGVVTAVGGGTSSVTATVEGVSGTATITVPVPIGTLSVSPATTRMTPEQTTQLTANLKDAAGFTLVGRPITWVTSNAAVATVSQVGLVTAVTLGSATITATAEGKAGSSAVTVVGWKLVRAGGSTSCGLVSDGTAYCWGNGGSGQLGDGGTGGRYEPFAVGGGFKFDSMSVGDGTVCALDSSGKAYCWGSGTSGQLGNGAASSRGLPQAVSGSLLFKNVAVGLNAPYFVAYAGHVCGVASTGDAWCWGEGGYGQLGNGSSNENRSTPTAVLGGLKFSALATGYSHTCGLVSGLAYCWGYNAFGQLGDGTTTSRLLPTPVTAPGLSFKSISGHGYSTCAVTVSGYVYCWGENNGQFGDGTSNDSKVPVLAADGLSYTSVSIGANHACGVDRAGKGYCWGSYNYYGELGHNNVSAAVSGGYTFSAVAVGYHHSCGLSLAGAVLCWGSNYSGQVGAGDSISAYFKPVVVRLP